MADQTISIGNIEDAFIFDDTEFYSDGTIPLGMLVPVAPTTPSGVMRLADMSTATNPLIGLQYVVMALTGTLTGERKLTAGTGVTLTDGGANGNATIAIGQEVATTSDVTFDDINATGVYKVDGTQVVTNQQSAITSLTDSTGGTANDTLIDVATAAIADPAKINDNFADVAAKVDAILAALRTHGLIAT